MRKLLNRMMRFLSGTPSDDQSCAGEARTEVQVLQEKIRKWERQADEYEAMGVSELARLSRESIRWHRLKLKTLLDPTLRRAA